MKKKFFFIIGCLKNDYIFRHNGFINVDKKYQHCLEAIKKVLWR